MDSCYNIERLRLAIVNALNSSGLTVGCALFVVKDICNELQFSFNKALEGEKCGNNITTEEEVIPLEDLVDVEKENEND